MDSRFLSPVQRLFLWTLRHWGAAGTPALYALRTLRTHPAGPTLVGVADRLLSWHHRRGRGPRHLGAPSTQALTEFEGQLLAAPYCARYHSTETLRLWLADHFDAAGLEEAPTLLQPLAEALEALGPEALVTPTRVQAAAYGSCPSFSFLAAAARSR